MGFATKFKKQFCRCVTVLILSKDSILVSLDKRSIVWERLGENTNKKSEAQNITKSVSLGDVVIRMADATPKNGQNVILTKKVMALT